MISLLGRDLLLWHSTFFEKPPTRPDAPEEYPWHQDMYFWQEPIRTVSAWLAITPVTVANGCIEVIPSSHKQTIPWITEDNTHYSKRFFGRMADPAYVNADNKVPMALAPGQFFLFTERTLHHSGPNHTQETRLGLSIRVTVPTVQIKEKHPCIVLSGADRFGLNTCVQPPVSDPGVIWPNAPVESLPVESLGQDWVGQEALSQPLEAIPQALERALATKEAV